MRNGASALKHHRRVGGDSKIGCVLDFDARYRIGGNAIAGGSRCMDRAVYGLDLDVLDGVDWQLNGLLFNGTSERIALGNQVNNNINGAPAITVEGLINNYDIPGAGVDDNYIFAMAVDADLGSCAFANIGSTMWGGGRSVSTDAFQSTSTPYTDTYKNHYIVGIVDYQGDLVDINMDGDRKVSTAVAFGNSAYTKGTPTRYECIGSSTSAVSGWFNGLIRKVKIWNYRRYQAQILQSWIDRPLMAG